ncbi:Protein CLEC16A [Schistosoma japonicum]|nr:Protein CLEC16A [Schistosoma japonicum]KAH8873891.1 Protein CLEC16A [Schistosoma japonicum]
MLIWGNQNDSSVMENILEYFLQFMKEDSSRRICVQLLQTLNILFENMTNQTAIYYLLSNNHTNAIITHRFDFTDEEVVAYCISFLKILSFRLNINTISFFYIESRREFDLYVEAIKLFAHPESMVRIAVRTITLNVHKGRNIDVISESIQFSNNEANHSNSHHHSDVDNTTLDCYAHYYDKFSIEVTDPVNNVTVIRENTECCWCN